MYTVLCKPTENTSGDLSCQGLFVDADKAEDYRMELDKVYDGTYEVEVIDIDIEQTDITLTDLRYET